MSKVESFYWNKLSNESWSVESEQFFYFCFVWLPSGAFALTQDESQDYGKSTKVVFLERELSQFKKFLENLKGLVMLYFRIGIDFRYCDFHMLILGLANLSLNPNLNLNLNLSLATFKFLLN